MNIALYNRIIFLLWNRCIYWKYIFIIWQLIFSSRELNPLASPKWNQDRFFQNAHKPRSFCKLAF